MYEYKGKLCPQCEGQLSRVHRSLTDHLWNLVTPVRRYRCRATACRWEGLLLQNTPPGKPQHSQVFRPHESSQ
jgi:hypothetical protein